jgi:hypothetical protein
VAECGAGRGPGRQVGGSSAGCEREAGGAVLAAGEGRRLVSIMMRERHERSTREDNVWPFVYPFLGMLPPVAFTCNLK